MRPRRPIQTAGIRGDEMSIALWSAMALLAALPPASTTEEQRPSGEQQAAQAAPAVGSTSDNVVGTATSAQGIADDGRAEKYARELYGLRRIKFVHIGRHLPKVFRGNDVLDGAELYQALGRQDLAEEYEAREQVQAAWRVGAGIALGGAGAALMLSLFWNLQAAHESTTWLAGGCVLAGENGMPGCHYQGDAAVRRARAALYAGGALAGAALTAGLVSLIYNRQPATTNEVHAMVDKYNEALRQELGVENERGGATPSDRGEASPPHRRDEPLGVQAVPYLMPSGGGLALALSF
jgi:hypothetical protein